MIHGNGKIKQMHTCARDILQFLPKGEREHYRCPSDFEAGRFVHAPAELIPELHRFFAGHRGKKGLEIHFSPSIGEADYAIIPDAHEIRLCASSLAGWRNALFELESQLLAGGPHRVVRHEKISARIGRILCGPINRPPLHQDELSEDFDYYPADYLNELARSGVNGVWISSDFRKLTGEGCEKRLARLRNTVKKCAGFGIRVYVFCIEPIAYEESDPLLKRHPELGGPHAMGKVAFCPSSARARQMLHDTTFRLFQAVPGLGGIIDLTVGEWLTLCCNVPHHLGIKCPHCGNQPRWKTLNTSLQAMTQGMKKANPTAELISWPYTQSSWWSPEEALEAAEHPLDGVSLAHNFESGGVAMQAGKKRVVKDYWLSYVGPSDFFREAARRQLSADGKMYAKLQVSCSTEIATTGYLPVPGLLYRKYRQLQRLGVSGVIMGWYFGCCPSLMTRAALRLSRTPFPASETAFLRELAAERWGGGRAAKVAGIWRRLSNAYEGYPLSNQIAYTGPMHDSINWELHLFPVNTRLAATWCIHAGKPGDRIFDCLNSYNTTQPFSLEEIHRLVRKMAQRWQDATDEFSALDDGTLDTAQRLEIATAQAVGLLFQEASDIFRFYLLRDRLIFQCPTIGVLKQMRKIAEAGIARSEAMLQLMSANPLLGYHSEACGYKFTIQSVRHRVRQLKTLLDRDLPKAEALVRQGIFPAEALLGGPRLIPGKPSPLAANGVYRVEYDGAYPADVFEERSKTSAETTVTITPDHDGWLLTLQAQSRQDDDRYRITWEPQAGHKPEELILNADGSVRWWGKNLPLEARRQDKGKGYALTIRLPSKIFGSSTRAFIRLNVERNFSQDGQTQAHFLARPHYLPWVFTLVTRDTRDSGWLVTQDFPPVPRRGNLVWPRRSKQEPESK